MQRDSKNSRLGPQSVAGSYVSNRSEGQKSLASLASMLSEKVSPSSHASCVRTFLGLFMPFQDSTPFLGGASVAA